MTRLRPKSVSFTSPCPVKRMLSGLRSRWTKLRGFLPWTYSRAETTAKAISMALPSGIWPFIPCLISANWSRRVPPEQYSVTMAIGLRSAQTPRNWTMWGCASLLKMESSILKMDLSSSVHSRWGILFNATLIPLHRARVTVAKDPFHGPASLLLYTSLPSSPILLCGVLRSSKLIPHCSMSPEIRFPTRSLASRLASLDLEFFLPASSSSLATLEWFPLLASCHGVWPQLSTGSVGAPYERSQDTISFRPDAAAMWRHVLLS
mmetsp:Transcript_2267/g.8177  ORF Transcript_2267/g.8177 Transcript_2267/m.8177 type:complete len:263 (+) Transcript_2267:2826-3614(+)